MYEEHGEPTITTEKDLKRRMRECLTEVKYDGTFFSFTKSTTYVNPGLHISNFGSVGLPLASRDAEAIARICKQSPFGKGSEAIIDTSVRKTWELDRDQFECRNPAWTAYSQSLVQQAIEGGPWSESS